MNGRRLAAGIDLADFAARTGFDARALFARPFEQYAKLGLLAVIDTAVRLTDRGWDVADALAGELLWEAGE